MNISPSSIGNIFCKYNIFFAAATNFGIYLFY